jgi:biotin-(acetyl-CoA carboxylase) ligase
MDENLRLPPIFHLVAIGRKNAAAEACRLAKRGADPATLVWARREDFLDCAVVLSPETPLAEARLVLYAGMLGLGDALGALVPAGTDVTYRWPNVLEVNLAAGARLSLAAPPQARADETPAWLVLRAEAALGLGPDSKPPAGFGTTLRAEGCAGFGAADLLGAYSRHLLTWINRWMADGFDPVRAMWLRHAPAHGETLSVTVGGRALRGVFDGIGDDGAMLLRGPKTVRRVALDRALAG